MFNSYIARYKQSAFARNLFTALTGTAAAQLIQVLGAPLLAYVFSPEAFGVFSLYIATAGLFSVVATLRYEMAVTMTESESDARILVWTCFAIACVVSIISIGLVGSAVFLLPEWNAASELGSYLWLIPISVLLTGAFQALYYFALRNQRFRLITVIKILQASAFVAIPLILWQFGNRDDGLVWGYVLHQLFALLVIASIVLPTMFREKTTVTLDSVMQLLRRYRNLPGLNALHAFTDAAQQALLNVLISTLYGNAALGLFALAYRALRAPASVISAALSQVLFQRMSENYNKAISNAPLFRNVVAKMSASSIPVFAIVALLAPWLFEKIMGSEWRSAGVMVQCLSPWIAATFISSPMSHLPNIVFKQFHFLIATLFINVIAFASFVISWFVNPSVNISLLAFAVVWGLGCIWLLRWFASLSHQTVNHR